MASDDEPRDQIVTWGRGGPDRTVTGMTRAEADAVARDVNAWGPVRLTRGDDGVTRWGRSGNPVPEGIARSVDGAKPLAHWKDLAESVGREAPKRGRSR